MCYYANVVGQKGSSTFLYTDGIPYGWFDLHLTDGFGSVTLSPHRLPRHFTGL